MTFRHWTPSCQLQPATTLKVWNPSPSNWQHRYLKVSSSQKSKLQPRGPCIYYRTPESLIIKWYCFMYAEVWCEDHYVTCPCTPAARFHDICSPDKCSPDKCSQDKCSPDKCSHAYMENDICSQWLYIWRTTFTCDIFSFDIGPN